MSHHFDPAPIAKIAGIAAADLGIELIAHHLDGVEYESVLLFNKTVTAPAAGVLAVPNYFGISQKALQVVTTTAGLAQPLFIADVYGKTVRPATPDEALATIIPLKQNRAELRKRMQAALDAFKSQDKVKLNGKLAAHGYCFGGTAALELARSGADLKAFASLHGALDTPTPQDAKNIKGAVLVLHGVLDPSVPREQVNAFIDEVSAAGIDWQLVNYGLAAHSFTDPEANNPGYYYHQQTAERAAVALKNFFAVQLA
ncbi:dienelactone hydrolase [Herbaspirillum sp. Sphag1AN]|uniref:dienelactone hydrolase family protein n=1 Tax=unclassified Herbaspirillum TaxID=2624150 RepID=UPI0016160E29|nr:MULTISPECIES: dienelactone hydrolase family protein [unclassified Herbaspirillum]MBB3211294.1 dienelactone hydrolase [Herbaspirillum sp. Sphag1AN]MBB3244923.1 dienelactone hydrolase [Herbaspirillum sp. Sphag64]